MPIMLRDIHQAARSMTRETHAGPGSGMRFISLQEAGV